jgi:hypothetical protein
LFIVFALCGLKIKCYVIIETFCTYIEENQFSKTVNTAIFYSRTSVDVRITFNNYTHLHIRSHSAIFWGPESTFNIIWAGKTVTGSW